MGVAPHLGHVTKSSCLIFFFHFSQKLSHDIWFQITQQLRKTNFKSENSDLCGRSDNYHDLDIHVASLERSLRTFPQFQVELKRFRSM